MRLSACAAAAFLFSAGCGYVGPVLPPSPQIPATITDLAAVERGPDLVVTFTTPARTTDGVAIAKFSSIDLHIDNKAYAVDLPPPSSRDDPQPKPMAYTLKASDLGGQRVSIAVRTAVRQNDHYSAWSNRVLLNVIPPLAVPTVTAGASANGIVLTWNAAAGVTYSVQRQSPSDKQPLEIASVDGGKYEDRLADYDTAYRYIVTAKEGSAESLPSKEISYVAIDKFAPAVPTGLTVLAGPDAVNLAWQRNTERDLQGYYIYRSTNAGPFEHQGALATLPTYADQNVEHGKTYAYRISAVDKKGNESDRSIAVEVQY